ncbi:Kinesin domain-containing protein/CH domain-containing protein [Cephalotus follicularis]|uniref:Kinesin domain-containing protein/CH domain-containing protein n=1 Tax=Cephalotus follicularis TaxID=3775 RepID=A0A1Q3CUC7_CEPFO|nr:Kinesin domain-containing protein/CH domain-containing protein [Cephalotus follicularis]
MESFQGNYDGNQKSHLLEWLNRLFPHLNLPLDASEDELRACLIDGSVLCSILNKLTPGSVAMGFNSEPGPANVLSFLEALDELGLPKFELSDLERGNMVPVLQCLQTLEAQFNFGREVESIQNYSRKRWNSSEVNNLEGVIRRRGDVSTNGQHSMIYGEVRRQNSIDNKFREPSAALTHHVGHKLHEVVEKQGNLLDAKTLEFMKSNSIDNATTNSLFNIVSRILEESIERKNGDVPQRVALILRKVVRVIEQRISTQAGNIKKQNNLCKAREERYHSRLRVLETLAKGTTEENEVVMRQLHQMEIEKSKIEEKEKLVEQDVLRLKKEKDRSDNEILTMKQELELAGRTHENHCLQLEADAEKTKAELVKKVKDLECLLVKSGEKVKELESFSESKYRRWKKKERAYRSLVDYQCGVLQDLREAFESIKHEVLKTKRSYSEELKYLGVKLKGLVDAAENYHVVLAENRKLYNEVQDLKGNIRVYCRIRPFLPGQSKKHTTIEHMGDSGELIVANPSKPGKDSHRLFKFNKVFGPLATQEEVFLDTQPLIRSVLDGYNVCIFAYGQTGSGKTYTMTGPNVSSKDDWGVNYRALNDLFQISQCRKSSIMYEVGVQMVEIYNEQVRDLLSNDTSQKRLGIWNTAQPNGLAVPDASMHAVKSTTDVLELMNIGLMNRAVGATALNERSSRSHSVLTVHVRGMDSKTGTILRGSLHLVDLAGSERVDRSEATGERLREAQHINKSLSALGDVIFALAQKSSHVPYRNSKLTQVLQSSLGGQAKTLMFVQLNPDVDSYSETISTLKFAERVSGVELGAARTNKEGRDLRELMEQVASLKETIAKKEEEVERLQLLKANVNGSKHGMSSLRCGSFSPRRHSMGTPRVSQKLSRGEGSRRSDKSGSDMDNCSEYSDKHSDAGSQQSVDDFRHHKAFVQQSKLAGGDVGRNLTEDVELLGFGDADSDERLSDISDGGLSMGAETEASLGSVVEFTLFPEDAKSAENTENTEKPTLPIKLPKPPQKLSQAQSSRLSLTRGSSLKFPSSAGKSIARNVSSKKLSKPWQ